MLISWPSGFGILIFLHQIKAKEPSFILRSEFRWKSWGSRQEQSLRYDENRKGVGKNNQARRCTEKCSYPGHRVSHFYFFYIKSMLRGQALFWDQKIWILICRARDTKKIVWEYLKEGRNNQARRCTEKCSYPSHRVSEFQFFYFKSKLRRQALFLRSKDRNSDMQSWRYEKNRKGVWETSK